MSEIYLVSRRQSTCGGGGLVSALEGCPFLNYEPCSAHVSRHETFLVQETWIDTHIVMFAPKHDSSVSYASTFLPYYSFF